MMVRLLVDASYGCKDYSRMAQFPILTYRLSVIVNDKFVGILRGKGQRIFNK